MVSLRLLILAQEKDALSAAHVLHRDKHRAFCPGSLIGFSGYSPTQTSHQNWQAKFLLIQTKEGKRCKEISPIKNKHGWMHMNVHTYECAHAHIPCLHLSCCRAMWRAQPVFLMCCYSQQVSRMFMSKQQVLLENSILHSQAVSYLTQPAMSLCSWSLIICIIQETEENVYSIWQDILSLYVCIHMYGCQYTTWQYMCLFGLDNLSIHGPKLWRNVPLLLRA